MRREISIPVLISLPTIIIIIIIIGSTSVHHRREHRGEHIGCSTSCGVLSIRPPIRLKGDPYYCGDSKYELTCDDSNKTILELPFGEYYVTNIWYDSFTMQVVDPNLACDCCRPPYRFPSDFPSYMQDSGIVQHSYNTGYYLMQRDFVSFMKCSKTIPTYDYIYNVSCMSGNNTYVLYASYGISVGGLLPSCSFLSMVPIDISCLSNKQLCLQMGFFVTWVGHPVISHMKHCFITASSEVKYFNQGWSNSSFSSFVWVFDPFYFGEELIYCLTFSRHHNRALFFIACWDTIISLLVIAIIARLAVPILSIYVFLAHEYWKIMVPINTIEKFLQQQQTPTPTRYAYTDIIVMTDNFKEKLGQGGFGSVFKGELLSGRLLVAVKLLGNSKCNEENFINEVATIGRIHHHKSNVYSFGMLLMEMAGGRRNVDNSAENSSQVYYPSWIYDQLKQSEQPEIGIAVTIDDMEKNLCKIDLWCIQMRPSDRPSMSKVIEMLEAEVDTLEMAPKPFVSAPAPVPVRQSYIDSSLSESSIISEDD